MLLTQKGPSFWIQPAPGTRLELKNDAELGANWSDYPYADPFVRSLNATVYQKLAQGESYLFATVLHGDAGGNAEPWALEHLANQSAVRLNAGDEHAANLEFAGAGNDMGGSFDCLGIIVSGRIMAHGYNLRFEFQRGVAYRFAIERINHDCCHIAFSQAETGMTIPGDFHPKNLRRAIIHAYLFGQLQTRLSVRGISVPNY